MASNVLASVATRSLRATFFVVDRRVAHRIELIRNGKLQSVLLSLEGNDDEQWPASPALQSVHVERHNLDEVAFLVGMAGRNHWSASVKADSKLDRIVFEIACRVALEPLWLGSSYRLNDLLSDASHSKLPVLIDAAPPLSIEAKRSDIGLSMPLAQGAVPRTISWSYSVAAY